MDERKSHRFEAGTLQLYRSEINQLIDEGSRSDIKWQGYLRDEISKSVNCKVKVKQLNFYSSSLYLIIITVKLYKRSERLCQFLLLLRLRSKQGNC